MSMSMEEQARIKTGDRVVVEPFSAYLRRPAPGGVGTVEAIHRSSFGDYLTVLLDSGERRHPFVNQVEAS